MKTSTNENTYVVRLYTEQFYAVILTSFPTLCCSAIQISHLHFDVFFLQMHTALLVAGLTLTFGILGQTPFVSTSS